MVHVLETMSDWLSVGTDIKINQLRDYLSTLKTQLDYMADNYNKEVEAEAHQILDEKERQDFYEWSGEEYWNYKETFPRILLNSFHIAAYTLLESEIYSLARRVGTKQNHEFDASNKKGKNYLKHACDFINELTNIDANNFTSWTRLDDGRILRNCIVHSNGKLTKKNEIDVSKKYGFIDDSTIEFPSVRSIVRLSITYEYCQSFLVTMRDFFTEFYSNAGKFL